MAGIFPPSGVPPAPEVCDGYTPINPVTGEGPLYAAPECTTTLLDCTFNAIVSEILAGVDLLGVPYNSGRVDNLGRALRDRFDSISATIDARVLRSGDAMTGPLELAGNPVSDMQASTKLYTDQQVAALQQQVNNTVVLRSGSTMSGPLILNADPVAGLGAATKQYVDSQVGDGITEPPADLQTYGRVHGSWAPVLPLAGGTITGALNVREPVANTEAATKYYVDALVAQGGTFVDAPADGFTYGRLSHAWERVLPLAGGTMTGALNFNIAAPTQNAWAVNVIPAIPDYVNPTAYVRGDGRALFQRSVTVRAFTTADPILAFQNSAGADVGRITASLANNWLYLRTSAAANPIGITPTGSLDVPGGLATRGTIDITNIAAGMGAWRVFGPGGTNTALVYGNGAAVFSGWVDIKGITGSPNPRLRFLDTGGSLVGYLWFNSTLKTFSVGDAGDVELVNIDSDGNIRSSGGAVQLGGIGISNWAGMNLEAGPGSDFYIRANANYYFRYNAGVLYWFTSQGAGISISDARDVTVGRQLWVGTVAYKPGGGPFADSSDARIKDRVADYTTGLDAIRALRPVSYHFLPATGRDTEKEHIGLVAQEAESAMPECVSQQKITLGDLQLDDMRMLDTGPIVFALVNAVKKLADDNDQLRARVAALEKGRKR